MCAGRVCVRGLCGLRQSPRARPDAAQRLCLVLASQDLAEELAAPLPPARRGVSLSLACRLALARAAPSQTRSILERIIKVSKQPARLENTFGRCFPDTMPGAGAHINVGAVFTPHRAAGVVWCGYPKYPHPQLYQIRCLDRGGGCTWARAPLAWPLRGDISIIPT